MELTFRSTCPISSVLDIVGDKWSLLILRDIMFSGKKIFSEFAAPAERIATGIYSLADKGLTFLPVVTEVILWSDRNLSAHITEDTRELAEKIRKIEMVLYN